MAYNYNYTGGSGGSFNFTNNPPGDGPNDVTLINQRNIAQGTTYIQIQTQTDCALSIGVKSYSLQQYDDYNIYTQGPYYDSNHTQMFYAITDSPLSITTTNSYFNTTPVGWVTFGPTINTGNQNVNTSFSIFVPKNKYLYFIMTGPRAPTPSSYDNTAMIILTGLPSANGFCFGADSKILMGDGTYKKINEIKRNDVVIQDIETGLTSVVSNVYNSQIFGELIKIPARLMGNSEDVICTKLHPIWINNNMRIYAHDLGGVEIISGLSDLYNLQFDEEGTFIVDGIKVDSLSPYHKYNPLPKELFIDQSKFIEGKKVRHENDLFRNKPTLRFNKN